MNATPKYSIVIPVYNRPEEVDELLKSLTQQSYKNFDVTIIEDGSSVTCEKVVKAYSETLTIQYFFKPNSGPGPSRNFGFERAKGAYFVVFDSDCILPPDYFQSVDKALQEHQWDAWGGPDKGHENFTIAQRAMAYTMSSLLTTGGIRGGKKSIGWFQPRSFNMGISRQVYERTKGFAFDRFAEDIEFSIRMKKSGFRVGLIPEAFVYHKRRATLGQFYKQVFNFGKGRALVGVAHPEEVKVTHWFPTFFSVGMIVTLLLPFFSEILFEVAVAGYGFYFLIIFIHAWIMTKNVAVAMLSVPSAFLQLWGYGTGFLREWLNRS